MLTRSPQPGKRLALQHVPPYHFCAAPAGASAGMRRLHARANQVECACHNLLLACADGASLPAGAAPACFTRPASDKLVAEFESWFFAAYPNMYALVAAQSLQGYPAQVDVARVYMSFFANLLDSDRLPDGSYVTFDAAHPDANRLFVYEPLGHKQRRQTACA